MINADDAIGLVARYLGDSQRARHSVFVGFLMMRFAETLGEDSAVWEVTGLCHDLDFEVTAGDRSRHGMLTAEWLRDDLPDVALLAIQAHDHRTGIRAETMLADALKLADAVALGELEIGRDAMLECLRAVDPFERLENALSSLPYLAGLITRSARNLSLPPMAIEQICRGAPQQ